MTLVATCNLSGEEMVPWGPRLVFCARQLQFLCFVIERQYYLFRTGRNICVRRWEEAGRPD